MTLLDRVEARRTCAVVGCGRTRDWPRGGSTTLWCREHLDALWANRLDRLPDGTYQARRTFTARDLTGEYR